MESMLYKDRREDRRIIVRMWHCWRMKIENFGRVGS